MGASISNILPASLVQDLYLAYQRLAENCLLVRQAVLAEKDYPLVLPTFGLDRADTTSPAARIAAAESMTQLFFLSDNQVCYKAGILCASPETVQRFIRLNKARDEFKDAVLSIKRFMDVKDASSSVMARLIADQVTERGYRTEELKQALLTVKISQLDLRRCYALNMIMKPDLDVFSWTWARTHTRVEKFTLSEVLAMVGALKEEQAAVAHSLLASCNSNDVFARKVKLPHQLRANYANWIDGVIVRKSTPLSGIVVAQQTRLPRYLYRPEPPENPETLPRASVIENEIFIKSLGLYKYAK
jgi:hypothetical protein